MKHIGIGIVSAVSWIGAANTVSAQSVATSIPIGSVVGKYAQSQTDLGLYGSDLGIAVNDGTNLRVLFGDSWKDATAAGLGGPGGADDALGNINRSLFPDGDAIEAWLNTQTETPIWRRNVPIAFNFDVATHKVAPQLVYDKNQTLLAMGAARGPGAAFVNRAQGGGIFTYFVRSIGTFCDLNNTCSVGECDALVGTCDGNNTESAIPCIDDNVNEPCACQPPKGFDPLFGGVCVDTKSSTYDPSDDGRILSTVLRNRIGNADPLLPNTYYSQEFATRKFYNMTTRTVRDFSPLRQNGVGNDYGPATGATGGGEKVLIWGRPNFAAFATKRKLPANLYFAYADMPSYSATGAFNFKPKYFAGFSNVSGCPSVVAGLSSGYPCFSSNQADAKALNLSTPGADPSFEPLDVPDHHTISFLPSLNKFVMIYGGDQPDVVLGLLVGSGNADIVHNPEGAMYVRFASQPWGPWSAPKPILKAGDLKSPAPGTQYASNGALYNSACTGTCAASEPLFLLGGDAVAPGRLYAAHIVEEFTEVRSGSAACGAGINTCVDLYWFASTWNPYAVVLVKTRVNP